MKIREIDRDPDLAVAKKDVFLSSSVSLETPSKSIRRIGSRDYRDMAVNEITRRIDVGTFDSLETHSRDFSNDIKSRFVPDKFNLTIFDLTVDEMPTRNQLRILSHCLYAASEKTYMLPTVKNSLFTDHKKLSEKKFKRYMNMMEFIIEETESVGNSKTLIGTIPLIANKFSRQLIELYRTKGLNAFSVDANFKDVLGHEADFRFILSEINSFTPLDETLICAFNCGFPRFEKTASRADDFLTIFAYVDVLGGTFKRRKFPFANYSPRIKVFSRREYSYDLCSREDARSRLGCEASFSEIRDYNQIEQLRESNTVRTLVGRERILPYVQTKSAVDDLSVTRLRSIASSIK